MSLKNSRRHFLKRSLQSLAAAGFADVLLSKLFTKLTAEAFASTITPNPSGYYFNLSLYAAPPRWLFDLPLTPMGKTSSNFVQKGFGTGIENMAGVTKSIYNPVKKVVAGQTLWLPPVWDYHSGGKNFDTVLNHALFVRGMDMEINNHAISNQRQVSPVIGGLSLTGVVADDSDRPLPAISDSGPGAAQIFKSNKGLSPSLVGTTSLTANVMTTLLAPFKAIPTNRLHNKDQNLNLQSQAFEKLELELKKLGFTDNAISDSYEKAADLLDSNIQSLANNYPSVRDKYLTLIKTAFSPSNGSLPGLNSSAISPTTDSKFSIYTNLPASLIKFSDLRDMADPNIEAPRMAQNFALMELLTDRLSTSFSMTFTGISKIPVSGTSRVSIGHDQHSSGVIFSTFITTLYYRAFLSCLTEFVGFLKAKNIFDKSIIHISSEFNRNPRVDGSGSDHGVAGSCATLVSGMFNKPCVLGNIKKNGDGLGTWGLSAPFSGNGDGRAITPNDVAKTITTMLGVRNIVTNGYPLLKKSGNLWVPVKVEAKNV